MLTLNDGRAELWQWDTGRTLSVDADCSQVHFSNKVFGRSIDVDVADGAAVIPDILLQTDKDLNVWAFVGTAENGYTKISKTFKVNRRNKTADYVFTPTDQMTMQTIQRQIGDLADLTTEAKNNLVAAINEAAQSGGGGGSTVELDTTLTQSGKAADAKAAGDAIRPLSDEIKNLQTSGLTTAQVNALDGMFKVAAYIKADVSAEYTAFKTAFGITDEPVTPEVTLSSISATYSGGDVAVGTAVADLTGIVVTAHYSDGTSETVTGYTLSGTIAEGNNTITVSYGGKTATFTVNGVAESGGGETGVSNESTWTDGVAYTFNPVNDTYIESNGAETAYTGWSSSPYLYCDGASQLVFTVLLDSTIISVNNNYNAFYDENKTFISNFSIAGIGNASADGAEIGATKEIIIPKNAAYFRVSHKAGVYGNIDSDDPVLSITPKA